MERGTGGTQLKPGATSRKYLLPEVSPLITSSGMISTEDSTEDASEGSSEGSTAGNTEAAAVPHVPHHNPASTHMTRQGTTIAILTTTPHSAGICFLSICHTFCLRFLIPGIFVLRLN